MERVYMRGHGEGLHEGAWRRVYMRGHGEGST